jgi:hypothetical protein
LHFVTRVSEMDLVEIVGHLISLTQDRSWLI